MTNLAQLLQPPLPPLLLLLLLQLTMVTTTNTTSSCQNSRTASYISQGTGYIYQHLLKRSEDDFLQGISRLQCASITLRRQRQFFSYDEDNQSCHSYAKDNILVLKKVAGTKQTAYYLVSGEWIKVYGLSMGAGSSVYDSFINEGNPSSWGVDRCHNNCCPNFFRHPILSLWGKLPIEEVKLEIYKELEVKATLVFDGRHSTIHNWFTRPRMKRSPWVDVKKASTTYFNMETIQDLYEFKIAYDDPNTCYGDRGWLAIILRNPQCSWSKFDNYPTIMYSHTNIRRYWTYGVETADSMAIFLRLREN